MLEATPTLAGLDIALIKKIMLLVFFAAFMAIVIRLILTRSDRYSEAARMPLDEDPQTLPKNSEGEPDHV